MSRSLTRTLGTTDLLLIVVGTAIGSGIFLVPGAVLQQSGGTIGIALLVWLVAGVLSLLGALTYGEMGAAKPEAGGLYVYIRDAFGPLPAFLYGWTMFFAVGSGSCATLAVAFTRYLGQFVTVSPFVGKLVAIAVILAVMLINVRGTRQSANAQNVMTAVKVGGILVMSVLLTAMGTGMAQSNVAVWPSTFSVSLLSAIGVAMISVLWAYEGWQYVTFSAGETKDPQKTFPRGIVIGTAALIAIYVFANVGYIAALGVERAGASQRIAAESVTVLFGSAAGNLIAAIILLSIFSAANGLTLTGPRVYYAMARDRVFFSRLAEVHPRFGTPAFAIVASSMWAMVLAASGTFEQLLTFVVFVSWIFFALGALAIFVYRRRNPEMVRPFRTPGYPVTPILFVLSAVAIVLNTIWTQPQRAAIGIAIVLLGVPAYLIWKGKASVPAREAPEAP
ncbi:MAG TPA: amino acid permease [Gemmatimonadaceae bacterium]|nr:amino acid permease [Gemmatimonadaceae bacterium]